MKTDENEETTPAAEATPPIALRFAHAWKRAVSFIIDEIIVYIILFFIFYLIYHKELYLIFNTAAHILIKQPDISPNDPVLMQPFVNFVDLHVLQFKIAQLIVEASYFALSWSASGQTIGGRIMKIFVMTLERKRVSILQGIVRYIIIYLTGMAFYILQIVLFNRVYQQRIHDFFTGTVVVEVPAAKTPGEGNHDNEFQSPESEV
ncbi:MAG: RDD family protein [Brevinematales bacterium]|jgi:uncharacterized RDD family membrane protein YckC